MNTAAGLQAIYGAKANTRKSSYYNVFSHVFQGNSSLTTIERSLHAQKKRVVATALADSSIKEMEELVLRNVRKFCVQLGETSQTSVDVKSGSDRVPRWSQPKNMTDWSDYLAFDIMGDICFSGGFNMLGEATNRYILRVLPEGVNGLNIVSSP